MIRRIPTVVTIEALKPHRKCDHHRNLTPIGRRARSPEKQGQFRSLATLRLRRGLVFDRHCGARSTAIRRIKRRRHRPRRRGPVPATSPTLLLMATNLLLSSVIQSRRSGDGKSALTYAYGRQPRSMRTHRSDAMVLLRWFRFRWAIGVTRDSGHSGPGASLRPVDHIA